MLLRRITEHVKAQNWFAVGLDFVIVVVGVFIGIQVANWNDARLTSARADELTERLLADLREEAWIYNYIIAYNEDVLASADATLRVLTGETTLDDEQFLINAFRASQYTWWTRRQTTFDELVSTGAIDLIKDTKLRSTALVVYSSPMIENIETGGKNSRYREAFRMTLPTDVHRAIKEHCGDFAIPVGDYAALDKVLSYDCALDLPQSAIDAAAAALKENANLIPALRLRIATLETQVSDLKENNEVTELFDLLKREAQ